MTPATARRIVTHPDQHSASLRLLAWCALKSGRGQPVRQSVLNRGGRCHNRRPDHDLRKDRPMTTRLDLIRGIVAKIADAALPDIDDTTELAELFDSLGTVQAVMAIEEELGIEFPDADLDAARTVADLVKISETLCPSVPA